MTENLTPERHEGLHEGASDAGATRVTAPADGGAGATRVAAPADDAARTTVVPPCAEAAAAVPTRPCPLPFRPQLRRPCPRRMSSARSCAAWVARVKRLRTAVVVLACVAVLLAGAVGALAWSVWGPSDPSTPQTEVGVVGGSSVGSSGSADASGSHDVGGTSGSGAAADDADEDDAIDPDNLRAADLLAIVGENWANAQRIPRLLRGGPGRSGAHHRPMAAWCSTPPTDGHARSRPRRAGYGRRLSAPRFAQHLLRVSWVS